MSRAQTTYDDACGVCLPVTPTPPAGGTLACVAARARTETGFVFVSTHKEPGDGEWRRWAHYSAVACEPSSGFSVARVFVNVVFGARQAHRPTLTTS